jgi:hypothetical protein
LARPARWLDGMCCRGNLVPMCLAQGVQCVCWSVQCTLMYCSTLNFCKFGLLLVIILSGIQIQVQPVCGVGFQHATSMVVLCQGGMLVCSSCPEAGRHALLGYVRVGECNHSRLRMCLFTDQSTSASLQQLSSSDSALFQNWHVDVCVPRCSDTRCRFILLFRAT